MKITDAQMYREIYEKWMAKQAEINTAEALLHRLESEATALKQQLDDYRLRRSQL
ncbi:hypothetical protein [Chroococcidiopsis sp.]|uniref:hypothetical protein n=1 Tax=Chroococcidiopsis sp. TaxID=3088168 RepID=UPI003F391026